MQNSQAQFELFSNANDASSSRGVKRGYSFFSVNLTLDNIVLIAICCLMLIVLSFSLGVEKGRRHYRKQSGFDSPVKLPATEKNAVFKPTAAEIKNIPIEKKQLEKSLSLVKRYTIQVATFEKQFSVQSEARELKKMGYEILIIPSGKYSQICVGRFPTRKEAEDFKRNLQKKYDDCYVRRL
ncbi:MAG: SPOR domain-containing protein [Candidatus Omnitrophota bacterium]|nr:SPOR domain-containing protein [Candidatus Omnitrophota bacterium]